MHAESPLKIGASAPGLEVTVDSAGNVVQDGNELGSKKKEESKNIGKAIVQVFLNKSGLGTTLVKVSQSAFHFEVAEDGRARVFRLGRCMSHSGRVSLLLTSCSPVRELSDHSIQQAYESVIDVGPGKEATDAKIRGMLWCLEYRPPADSLRAPPTLLP